MKKIILTLVALVLGSISSAMACQDLDQNVRAHATTWTTLYTLGQVNTSFINSGAISMNSLPNLGSIQDRILLADEIHQAITLGRGAKSITGNNEVLEALELATMNNETVCDFAQRLDEQYAFWQE